MKRALLFNIAPAIALASARSSNHRQFKTVVFANGAERRLTQNGLKAGNLRLSLRYRARHDPPSHGNDKSIPSKSCGQVFRKIRWWS